MSKMNAKKEMLEKKEVENVSGGVMKIGDGNKNKNENENKIDENNNFTRIPRIPRKLERELETSGLAGDDEEILIEGLGLRF